MLLFVKLFEDWRQVQYFCLLIPVVPVCLNCILKMINEGRNNLDILTIPIKTTHQIAQDIFLTDHLHRIHRTDPLENILHKDLLENIL